MVEISWNSTGTSIIGNLKILKSDMMREKDENVAAGLGQAQKCSLEKNSWWNPYPPFDI